MAKSKLGIDKEKLFVDLGYQPHPGQLEIHRSRAPRRVLACGVRWGKSLSAAMEGIAAALLPCERSFGWVVAPTYELADKIFREIVLIVTIHLRSRIVKLTDRELVLVNLGGGRSAIRAKSADNPDSLLGEGLDWVIVDEAARLKPEIWQSYLSQRLIDKKGWALLISTPRGKGWFFDLYRRGQDQDDHEHESWNLPSWSNPHLDRELIETERERLPERVFRQEFGGEFIEGEGSVFRYIRERATGYFQEPEKDTTYFAGLDLGRLADYTVLVIVNRRREVVFADRFHKIDWAQQIARVGAACERYNRCRVWCDVTGVGDPVYEALLRAGVRARAYPFTLRSKAALIDNLSLMLEHRKLTLPRPDLWPEGIDELESYEYSVTDGGTLKSGAPGGQHDDCVMALALAAWGVGFKNPARLVATWV